MVIEFYTEHLLNCYDICYIIYLNETISVEDVSPNLYNIMLYVSTY